MKELLDNILMALGVIAFGAACLGGVAVFSLLPVLYRELRDFLDDWL